MTIEMRPPELSFKDAANEEEPLHSFEYREADEEYDIDLAEKACDALHRYALDRTTIGLAELISDITERAYTLVESGMTPAEAVASIMRLVRERLQTLSRSGKYAFRNEDIFSNLGKPFEQGLLSDLAWLTKKFNESPGENRTHQIYTNGSLDNKYAIDFIEAIWNISPDNGELTLDRVDLVQNKSSNKLNEAERAKIIKKHGDFIRDNQMVMVKLRSVDTTEDQLRSLKAELGAEIETYLASAFEDAYTGPEEDALGNFTSALEQFKRHVLSDKHFMSANRALKRAYIEQLSFLGGDARQDPLVSNFSQIFDKWKSEWLGTVSEKRKRVLLPVQAVVTRSVISFTDQADEIEVISGRAG